MEGITFCLSNKNQLTLLDTLDSGINIGLRLLIFGLCSRGYVPYYRGYCIFFSKYPLLPNVQGATFIPGAMSIPESRVGQNNLGSTLR